LTILIGHSFGARILFSATSQVLIDAVASQHPGEVGTRYGLISGPADLIVLLNPAFEASMFTAMDSLRRPGVTWEGFHQNQQPVVLTISADNDTATKRAFPFGQRLAFASMDRQRSTLGNYERYVTHQLAPKPTFEDKAASSLYWFDDYEAAGLRLWRKPDAASQEHGDPFIVATTTPEVIDGHSGIWGDELTAWITGFLGEVQERATAAPERCPQCGSPFPTEVTF
jgi:hypothetical protein